MNVRKRRLGFEVHAVTVEDYPEIRKLYHRVWGRERSDTYDRMRFLETMEGLPIASCARSKDGELVGFFTLWPLQLSDGRRTVSAGEAMDVMTDERMRGKGVFPTLADQAARQAADRGIKVLFGAPNEAIFATYLKRLAWASPTSIRTYVHPLSMAGAVPMGRLAQPVLNLWPKTSDRSLRIVHEQPPEEALEACLASDRPKRGRWRLVRTPAWYAFRYREAGKFDYRWVSVWRDEKLAAFAIWGLATDMSTRLRRANIADVVGGDAAARKTAVTAAVRAAGRAGAHFAAATMTSLERAKEFTRNGFIPYSKSPLITKTLGPDAFDANPFTEDGWDLFGGDFDFI